ncbi:MAG TPA: glycoside hydrolase family 43 protein [Opitutaceae bacterium]|nr:glycoside hydrolase family 43 protein [Opitutaceae bacterium]
MHPGTLFQPAPQRFARSAEFTNPIAPGADPWVVRHEGEYLWCFSDHDRGVVVHRSRSLTELGPKHNVWSAPDVGAYSAQIWAPELHRIGDRWYIYVAASDGRNENHRMIVLESDSEDPTGTFSFKAELYTGDDPSLACDNRWAIDGTLLDLGGTRYFLWSGWERGCDQQWLYIAPMSNPWTIAGPRTRLCDNDNFVWERVGETECGRGLNEGPQILQRDGRVFVVFSCSASWEPGYKLGLLELLPKRDPLVPGSWRKHGTPVLQSSARTCGVGHCSFVKSPDGCEDWIVFHAKVSRRPGWERVVHAQRFGWTDAGLPNFGTVVDAGIPTARPSGDRRAAGLPVSSFVRGVRVVDSVDEASGAPVEAE